MPNLANVRFYITVVKITGLERTNLPEVAFAGRSNAGKSSAINAICRRKKLAFASRTPGRTQSLNFFSLDDKEGSPEAFVVDTPGYGYAQAPKELKKTWDQLAGRYLQVRGNLSALILIVDIRRGLGDLDKELIAWVQPNVPILVLLSKADKLGQQERMKALANLRKQPELANRQIYTLLFSVLGKIGIDEARAFIEYFLDPVGDVPPEPCSHCGTSRNECLGQKKPQRSFG
jgi:GTP-binding protein